MYKQVNNENEIEIKYKVFFQNFVGSERSEYNFNVKPRKPEKRKKLSLRVKLTNSKEEILMSAIR